MDKHLLNTTTSTTPLDFHLKSDSSPNGNIITNQSNEEDLEMVSLDSKDYTSLKDLMPTSSSLSMASPTGSMRDSWKEIPIKDQLVRNAAWAYLQPSMVETRDEDVKWWVVLKDKFCGVLGCINDVVLVVFYGFKSDKDENDDEQGCKVD